MDDKLQKHVKMLIKMHMAKHDLSAAGLAKKIGCTPSYLSGVINCKKPPSKRVLDEIGYEWVLKKKNKS